MLPKKLQLLNNLAILVFVSLILIFIFSYYNMTTKNIKAIAVFTDEVNGIVKFTEVGNKVRIDLSITGLKPNSLHGFHVHEAGDLSDKCTSMCAHFNPYKMTHGCPGLKNRHVGDLGNLQTNKK